MVAEACFTNPLVVAMTQWPAANGDEVTPTVFLSIQSDELRHRFGKDILTELSNRLPNLRLVISLLAPWTEWTGERGSAVDALAEWLHTASAPEERVYYVCGPAAMVDRTRDLLREWGVDGDTVITESFTPTG